MNFNSKEDDGVLAEFTSGELSAVVMLADDEAMKGESGPIIWTTMDENRVIVSFNEKAFNWRVQKMFKHFSNKNPEISEEEIMRECRLKLGGKMLEQSGEALDQYFQLKGLSHLGEDDGA